MERIYEIIDSEFPKKSITSAIIGPITDMGGFMERTEIDQLLQIIRHSANTGEEFSALYSEYDSVLILIYGFIKKQE